MLIIATFLAGSVAFARLVNFTIDDTHGDARVAGNTPRYTSDHMWWARSYSDGCITCATTPDGKQTIGETWHDETTFPGQRPSNVSFNFNGTALYIYCILAGNITVLDHKSTRLAFYLDGSSDALDRFLYVPNVTQSDYFYNQLVFKHESLSAGQHTMLVSNWADGESGSLIYFDYAVYTMEDGTTSQPERTDSATSPSSTRPSEVISQCEGDKTRKQAAGYIGAAGGGIVAAAAAMALWLYVARCTALRAEAKGFTYRGRSEEPGGGVRDEKLRRILRDSTSKAVPSQLAPESQSFTNSRRNSESAHMIRELARVRAELARLSLGVPESAHGSEPPGYSSRNTVCSDIALP